MQIGRRRRRRRSSRREEEAIALKLSESLFL
jgi:hypothetical protein